MKKLSMTLITAMLVISCLAGCGSQTATSDSTSASTGKSTVATESSATASSGSTAEKAMGDGWTKVGKDATVDEVQYTINGFKLTKGSELFKAEDGKEYLLIDMTAKNNTSKETPLSSIMMFKLTDASGKEYDISLIGAAGLEEEKLEQIDGSVAAKSERKGGVAYEIPEKTKGLKFTIKAILGDGDKTIDLN